LVPLADALLLNSGLFKCDDGDRLSRSAQGEDHVRSSLAPMQASRALMTHKASMQGSDDVKEVSHRQLKNSVSVVFRQKCHTAFKHWAVVSSSAETRCTTGTAIANASSIWTGFLERHGTCCGCNPHSTSVSVFAQFHSSCGVLSLSSQQPQYGNVPRFRYRAKTLHLQVILRYSTSTCAI
jgi:hypothetical protein